MLFNKKKIEFELKYYFYSVSSRLMFTNKFICTTLIALAITLTSNFAYADITFSFVGDMMLGSDHPAERNALPPNNGADIFASVASILRGSDMTFGNLETCIADGTTQSRKTGKNSYSFRLPPQYTKSIEDAGFDVLSVANNHSYDFGASGFNQTVENVEKYNMKAVGQKIDQATFITVKGKKIGFLAFYYFSHRHNAIQDITRAKTLVEKTKAECDYLVVTFHGGAEGGDNVTSVPKETETYYGENRGDVYKFSRAVSDAGADVVIGHGPHVLRAMEMYNGTLIAYSLGNFVGYRLVSVAGNKGIGAILTLTLTDNLKLKSAEVTSVRLLNGGVPVQDSNHNAVKRFNEYAKRDFPQTGIVFDENGKISF